MAKTVVVTDESGKQYTVLVDNITSIEHEPGEPDQPPVEAAEEVADDPGEEPSATNPLGRPPKKGHPKIEAKEGKVGTPDKSTIKLIGGDMVKVVGSIKALRDSLA